MPIIPIVRCSQMASAVRFYTRVLDFELAEESLEVEEPAFNVLRRGDDLLYLSSHSGDGEFGQAIVLSVNDVDALHREFTTRGLRPPANPDSPVHQGPIDQSWGTREFYVDDPDGNTLRFTEQ
ncbi:MAG TPA: VOC family protein [Longimicrobiaceae bacterium]